MKKIIILVLSFISLGIGAREYKCDVRNYRLTIDLEGDRSTHVWVRDLNTYSILRQGYAGSIERGQRVTSFYFYGQNRPLVLSFKNSDISERPDKVRGHIKATLEGFYFTDYMDCKALR